MQTAAMHKALASKNLASGKIKCSLFNYSGDGSLHNKLFCLDSIFFHSSLGFKRLCRAFVMQVYRIRKAF